MKSRSKPVRQAASTAILILLMLSAVPEAASAKRVSRDIDRIAPQVTIATPSAGSTVSDVITVTGSSYDNVAVASVETSVDGETWQLAMGTSSWTAEIDTTSLPDADHMITARAIDPRGNIMSTDVAVAVYNNPDPHHLVTTEGLTINVAPEVTAWTAQQVYGLLKPNAHELNLLGPSLTVNVQTQYPSSTSTSASSSGGVYTRFAAIMYLDARPNSTFTSRPDYVVAHEYGHAWTLRHLYLTQQKNWTPWLTQRGLQSDSRVDTSYVWMKSELIADDYRMLFGTPTAISQANYINPNVPDPRTVAGYRNWLAATWGGGG